MKKVFVIAFVLISLLIINPLGTVFALESDGDMSYDEGAKEYVPTLEDIIINKQKELEIKRHTMPRMDVDGSITTLDVPVFQQQNSYYCGLATVKQVIHYINGSSSSQSVYASALGTTSSGTDMTKISSVLKSKTGKNYVYVSIGTLSEWLNKISYGFRNKMPAILDINTNNVSAFPYKTSGHFVNTSGIDTRSGHCMIRITDPYGPGLGNRWYYSSDLYQANYNHSRKAMIY